MKKIIKQKRYNTETAQAMGRISYGDGGDFNHYEETLYRKLNGEFFLHGCGGARSKYAVEIGQSQWVGGEEIIPFTYVQAQNWVENNLSGDEYEQIFGEVEEGGERVTKAFSISKESAEKLKKMAAYRNMSMSALIEEMIMLSSKNI